jgi:hypothetical protein
MVAEGTLAELDGAPGIDHRAVPAAGAFPPGAWNERPGGGAAGDGGGGGRGESADPGTEWMALSQVGWARRCTT